VQLRSLRHASTQEDGQTIRQKHAPAAGKRQIHARISRSESGRHALPCVYPLRTHFAHASPLAYCCPYACNQRMCHITCVVAQVETQPNTNQFQRFLNCCIRIEWLVWGSSHVRFCSFVCTVPKMIKINAVRGCFVALWCPSMDLLIAPAHRRMHACAGVLPTSLKFKSLISLLFYLLWTLAVSRCS
jgi:hypothetical protein